MRCPVEVGGELVVVGLRAPVVSEVSPQFSQAQQDDPLLGVVAFAHVPWPRKLLCTAPSHGSQTVLQRAVLFFIN